MIEKFFFHLPSSIIYHPPPMPQTPKPVVLCVLDGWGCSESPEHNALKAARTPNLDALMQRFPMSRLQASEVHVGLPEGQMGNSEVGHMNIGSGRVVMQELPRINKATLDGSLKENQALREFTDALQKSGGACHLMGLLSPGGVHSHQAHMVALAKTVAARGIKVCIHAFLDGRDTPPQSATGYLKQFENSIASAANISIATVSGRYYAMDRDGRWERVKLAFDAMTAGFGHHAKTWKAAIDTSYANRKTDEFLTPTIVGGYKGMRSGDGVLMANFRADRAREILCALLDPGFTGFLRANRIMFSSALGMVEYSTKHSAWMGTLFPPEALTNILGEAVSRAGLKQLRIAETEKYAHVTFFFNGGREEVFPGEERILIPSPKVATYDLKPEMSAYEVTEALEQAIAAGTFDLIVVNYANADMVGHSGIMEAAVKAVETLDACVSRLWAAVEKAGGALLLTSDHGNIEQMSDPESDQPHTAHTLNPVPFVLMGPGITKENTTLRDGCLADLAPTVLQLMKLPQPKEMTGKSLVTSGG